MRLKSEKRRGIVAVLVAVSLVAILGVVAIALDGGLLLDNRRSVQAGADAAALAAAEDFYANWSTNQGLDLSGTARASALSTAKTNGYANDGTTSVVTVNLPPKNYLDGPNKGKPLPAGYAEVIIRYNQKRGFSSIFGSGDLPVGGRAVARGMRKASGIGVLLLNPTLSGSLTISGSAGMKADGSVIVDSSSSTAASASGGAGLNSSEMDITGKDSSSGSSYFHTSPGSIDTGVAATADFLTDVPVPDPTKIDDQGNPGTMTTRSTSSYKPTSGQTIQPGLYIGGISISSQPNITFAPGIYYLQGGGLTMSGGSSSFTATGVMIYNGVSSAGATGSITVSGGGTVVQSPPTSGAYYGMSIFQDRSSTQKVTLSGGSGWNFTGTVYAASAHIDVSGGSGATMGSQFVADTMTLSGSSTFNDIDPSKGYRPRDIRLTE
ncbi:MAG TPA: hypothetical protein DDY78_04245 [Planctomycetales bacterium]|jgi:hypothetical protein|nr:hypothetical protein [Planctomycetales bacterium]